MNCHSLERELAEYLEGSLSPEKRQRVSAHLSDCSDCRSTLEMWRKMEVLADVAPAIDLSREFRRKLSTQSAAPRLVPARRHLWAVAASLLVGVVGFVAGRSFPAASEAGDLANLRQEVRSLREVVALSLLEQQSASERLRGVRYTAALERPDDDVIGALAHTLRTDPSVNVRLAAADVLRKYAKRQSVRQAALDLLEQNGSALVQVAVIDLLLTSKEPRVVERLREWKGRTELDPGVRAYLDEALESGVGKERKWQ